MGQYAGIINQLSSRRTNNDIAVVAQRDARCVHTRGGGANKSREKISKQRRKEFFASLFEFSRRRAIHPPINEKQTSRTKARRDVTKRPRKA